MISHRTWIGGGQAAEVGSVFKLFSAFAIEFYPGITQRFSAAGWFPIAGFARLVYRLQSPTRQYARVAWTLNSWGFWVVYVVWQ